MIKTKSEDRNNDLLWKVFVNIEVKWKRQHYKWSIFLDDLVYLYPMEEKDPEWEKYREYIKLTIG
jgi:hypothetical protein